MARFRLIALGLGIVVALGLAAAFAWKPATERFVATRVADIGGPFALVDQDGRAFSRDNDLLGHPHIIYFGFTYCPDLCPTMLFELGSIVDELGEDAKRLKVVFVSVDPARDTQAVLRTYVAAFNDDFIGLTGSPEAIDAAAKAYKVFYRQVPLEGGSYTIDHTASSRLFNADGSYFGLIEHDEPHEAAAAKVAALLAANPG